MRNILTAIMAAVALAGCSGNGQNAKSEGPVHSVLTVKPKEVQGGESSIYSGIVREAHNVNVGFKTPGQIMSVNVKEGDYVREGQLIACLDDEDYKLGVEALQIQYDQVKDEVARLKTLYEKKSVSANDYEKAKAGLDQLGIQLKVNKNKLEYTKLQSPVSGYVQTVNFSKGEMVDAGTPVFVIMDVSSRRVELDIPASAYRKRDTFTAFTCSLPGGEPVALKMESIIPKADAVQLYRMTLSFAGRCPDVFVPGTNVTVRIESSGETEGNSCIVPFSAITFDQTDYYVFTVENGDMVSRHPVSVESVAGNEVRITGIGSDELVVRAGASVLSDGEKVRVIPQPSAANEGGLL